MTLDGGETGALEPRGGDSGVARPAALKVSVVVPVHNPGPSLERSIGSVLDQSMPRDQYEVIFVDDGSTDGSGERLDALAAERAGIVALHIPASGSPGRPRNTGIEHARGEYVQFLDADDRLGHRALERQYDMAQRNDADIVIGKLGSNFRGVHWSLFRRNIENGSLATAPVIANLTVCKMFRTALLRDHAIRFPEGWPKIEDEHFVVRSYLAAHTISVVADEPCYLYCEREDGGNLSSRPLDPDQYYGHLGEILALVQDAVPAGSLRAGLLRRFYQVEMLGRLAGDAFLAMTDDERARLVGAMRRLALDRIDDDVRGGLAPLLRVRSRLLREGRIEALVQLASRERAIEVHATASAIDAIPEGIRVRYRVTVRWADGSPFVLARDGQRWLLDPRLVDPELAGPDDTAVDPAALLVQAALHEQDGWLDWMVTPGAQVRLRPVGRRDGEGETRTPVATGTLVVDAGAPGPSARSLTGGRWAFMLRLRGTGIDLRTRAIAETRPGSRQLAAITHDPVGVARSRTGDDGVLELVVEEGAGAVAALLRERPPMLLRRDGPPRLRLKAYVGPAGRGHVRLIVAAGDGRRVDALQTAVHTVHDRSGDSLITSLPPADSLPAGDAVLLLRVGHDGDVPIGRVVVDRAGRLRVEGIPVLGVIARGMLTWADGSARVMTVVRRAPRAAVRRIRRAR